jgi:c-di-GMP-binding flagellar brake protein YcgR
MSASSDQFSLCSIELHAEHSRRLLEQAVAAWVDVTLRPSTNFDGPPLAGVLSGTTADGLVIRIVHPIPAEPAALVSVYCEVAVELNGARFLFSSNVVDAYLDGNDVRVEIARPEHLRVIQRRRYQRRLLHDSAHVSITPQGGGSGPIPATLLNISTGGLACRVNAADVALCAQAAVSDLAFTLADCDHHFCLPARVCGQTPGARADQAILSFEFLAAADGDPQRTVLADALYSQLAALTGRPSHG